jgi:high-affinity iron transporter
MLPSFLLALSEGLEAALLIGIVLGTQKKIRHPEFNKAVWYGVINAAIVSLSSVVGIHAAGASFEGRFEEIFEGVTMLLAAAVLTGMIFWMQRQAHNLKIELESDVRRAVSQNSGRALFALAFFVVVREGIELALFLTAASMPPRISKRSSVRSWGWEPLL